MRYNILMKNEEKTAASNAEMVTISRAEYDELKFQKQWFPEQLGLAKKRQFGSSSEKLQEEMMDQFSLGFNEAEGVLRLASRGRLPGLPQAAWNPTASPAKRVTVGKEE